MAFHRVITALKRAVGLVLCVALLGLALETDARAYKRNSKTSGPGGRSVSQDVEASRTGSGYERSATTTGPRNKSVNTDTTGAWDASTKTWSKDKTVTGPGGTSKTIEKDTTISK